MSDAAAGEPITIEKIDQALREILGQSIVAFMDLTATKITNRTRAMDRAAVAAWIEQRPEDQHTAVIREGLKNLARVGMIVPSVSS